MIGRLRQRVLEGDQDIGSGAGVVGDDHHRVGSVAALALTPICVARPPLVSAAWMLLCSVAAVVLKVIVAVPVVGLAAGLVYDRAKVLPLVNVRWQEDRIGVRRSASEVGNADGHRRCADGKGDLEVGAWSAAVGAVQQAAERVHEAAAPLKLRRVSV